MLSEWILKLDQYLIKLLKILVVYFFDELCILQEWRLNF